ncbi:MAG: O-antigen ligase family protein, partial [Candidatus Uhrbacteria bacterium]|nr:O-antigen ligase family protein [Candidatus Uhrbacteria bacterium]
SGQVRLFQWRETRQMLYDHWFFGSGLGGYPTVFKPYHKATAIEIFQYPHNILLNFWSETGLLGVIVFGWIVITWMRRAQSMSYELRVTSYAVMFAILIHGLVDVPYFKNDLAIIFWMLIFLTCIHPSRLAVDDPSEHK